MGGEVWRGLLLNFFFKVIFLTFAVLFKDKKFIFMLARQEFFGGEENPEPGSVPRLQKVDVAKASIVN